MKIKKKNERVGGRKKALEASRKSPSAANRSMAKEMLEAPKTTRNLECMSNA